MRQRLQSATKGQGRSVLASPLDIQPSSAYVAFVTLCSSILSFIITYSSLWWRAGRIRPKFATSDTAPHLCGVLFYEGFHTSLLTRQHPYPLIFYPQICRWSVKINRVYYGYDIRWKVCGDNIYKPIRQSLK